MNSINELSGIIKSKISQCFNDDLEKKKLLEFNSTIEYMQSKYSIKGKKMKRIYDAIHLLVFFTFGSLAFDLANPETGISISLIDIVNINQFVLPPYSKDMIPYFVYSNIIAGFVSFIFLLLIRKPLYRAPAAGFSFGIVGYVHTLFGFPGIINVVWHGVIGIILFALIIMNDIAFDIGSPLFKYSDISLDLDETQRNQIVEKVIQIRTELWDLIKLLGQMLLSFSAITGVVMTILFRQGYQDISIKLMGIQIASGFFICCTSLYLWVAAPSINLLTNSQLISNYLSNKISKKPL